MIKTKFKVLMCTGNYVDLGRLEDGIYTTVTPRLQKQEESIESVIIAFRQLEDIHGVSLITDKFFENLRKCELVEVTLMLNK